MKSKYSLLSVSALVAALFAVQVAVAQIPRNFTIQGVLSDSTSKPVSDGIHTITLRLYDKLIGGNVVYTEEYTTPIFKGLFNLTLGAKSPLPASIVFDKQYFVGVSYDNHSEIARIPFSSVPYSMMAETVPDGSITTSKIADGSITPEKLSFDFRSDKKSNIGLANSATGTFAFIGGGNNNIASGSYSAIIGGLSNKAQGIYSTAAGGNNNTASGGYSTVSGGNSSTASGVYSAVSGGSSHTSSGSYSTVSGGSSNSASGSYSLVSGGSSNSVSAAYAVIAGGLNNNVTGVYSAISGGTDNNVSGTYSSMGGGRSNTVSSSYSGVLGGYSNLVSSPYSAIVMGYDNSIAGDHSVVLGGYGLTLTSEADRTLGFLANSGSRAMTISEPMITVLGNTDVWIASNDGTTRALKLFSNNLNAAGNFPSTVAKNVAIKAPDSLPADYTLTLPNGTGTAGQILSTDGSGILSWSAAGASGSAGGDLTGTYPNPQIASGVIINSDINAAAAIDYSKLNLTGSITDADITTSAGIQYSKLTLTNSIQSGDITANAVNGTKIAMGSDATGDILYYDGTDYTRLPVGSNGNVLTLASGIPAWAAGGASGAAGGSLTGTYPNPTIATDAVSSTEIADGTITDVDVSGTAAIAYSKLNLTGSIINADIVAAAGIPYSKLTLTNSIQNIDIVANAITTSKVANGTVTTSKLADSAVSGLKLLTSAVTTGHINNNAVNGAKIAMGSDATGDIMYYDGTDYVRLPAGSNTNVLTLASGIPAWAAGGASGTAGGSLTGTYPNPTIATDAVSSTEIADGTITNVDVSGTAAIQYSKLTLTNSIQNADIVANAITTSKVANGTVTTSKLADSSVSGLKLLTSAVTTGHINNNAVNGAKIAMGSDATGDIMYYDGTDYTRLAAGSNGEVLTLASGIPSWAAGGGGSPTGAAGGSLTGTYPNPTIATDAVTTTEIADGTITNFDVSGTAAIQYSKLTLTNSIQNGDIVANAITTSKVANGTVTTSKLADSSVSGLKLLTSAVTTGHINNNAVTGTKIAMGSDATGDIMYYDGTDYVRRGIGSNGNVLTVSGGVPTWSAPSGGGGGLAVDLLATKTSAQTLPIGGNAVTPDDLTFNNVVSSPTVGSFDGTSYTVGATGLYMITVNVLQTSATIAAPSPQVLVNGTTVVYGTGIQQGNYQTGTFGRGELATVVSLTAGDVVKIKCANGNTASTLPISTDGTTRLSIMKF